MSSKGTRTVFDVFNELSENQKNVIYLVIGELKENRDKLGELTEEQINVILFIIKMVLEEKNDE